MPTHPNPEGSSKPLPWQDRPDAIELIAWARRHGLDASLLDIRGAFEDAATGAFARDYATKAITARLAECERALAVLEALATGEGWNTPIFSPHFGGAVRAARQALNPAASAEKTT